MEPDQCPPLTADEKIRLDRFLVGHFVGLSRAKIQQFIKSGCAQVNNRAENDPAHTLKPGDQVLFSPPPPEKTETLPENIHLDIVYEDDQLLVINKPAGLTVHPAAGHKSGTLVNALLHHCGVGNLSSMGGAERAGIVHRLDKDTSGLMVVAKTDKAHTSLSRQFANRTTEKIYWALVYGVPARQEGRIETNIGRHPQNRQKMAVLESGGKSATTLYKTLEVFGEHFALMELKLLTGRTHQIRVHLAHLGHPIVGDPVYVKGGLDKGGLTAKTVNYLKALNRQMLHAKKLGFAHPTQQKRLYFEAPLTVDFSQTIDLLRLSRGT